MSRNILEKNIDVRMQMLCTIYLTAYVLEK